MNMINRLGFNKSQLTIWGTITLATILLVSCTASDISDNNSQNIEPKALESNEALQKVNQQNDSNQQDVSLPNAGDSDDLLSDEIEDGDTLSVNNDDEVEVELLDSGSDQDMSQSVDNSGSVSPTKLLDGYGLVEGIVTDSDGNPLSYVNITVKESSSSVGVPEIALETGKEGKFDWPLPEGDVTLQFNGSGYETKEVKLQVVSGKVAVTDITLENVEGFVADDFSGVIIGIITDKNGNPLDGVSVSVNGSESMPSKKVLSEYGGSYFIELPAGEFVLLYELDGFESVERVVKIGHGGDEIVEIVMEASK